MIKRLFDIVVSITILVIISPVMLVIILLMIYKEGKPIFFLQCRPGLQGQLFIVYKFRTMVVDDTFDTNYGDAHRMTKLCTALRKYSLDELPQFYNVLKGDMSLVGPRPLLVEYLPLYTDEQRRRHNVRPGITGWAQVNGRNAISWEEKFKLDVWYVDNNNFFLDLKIMLLTVKKVFMASGVNSSKNISMPKFKGNVSE